DDDYRSAFAGGTGSGIDGTVLQISTVARAAARRVPSGLKAMSDLKKASGPLSLNASNSWPVATSQSFTSFGPLLGWKPGPLYAWSVAKRLPSGVNAILWAPSPNGKEWSKFPVRESQIFARCPQAPRSRVHTKAARRSPCWAKVNER